jgi:hypothetical protein
MPKIVDPDQLTQNTEVIIDTSAKTIQLVVAGNLDNTSPGTTSGVTLQALYSFLKEEWKDDATLNKFRFPIKMFTKTDGQFINGWDFDSLASPNDTRLLVRDGGWTEITGDQYACIISLGSFNAGSDQAYYSQVSGFTATTANFDKTGELNEAIKIYDGAASPDVDYTTYVKAFLRIQGKLYDEYDLVAEQGLSLLEPVLYRLPLSNATDLKITFTDNDIDTDTDGPFIDTGPSPDTKMYVDYLVGNTFATWSATTYSANAVVQGSDGRWYKTPGGGTSAGNSSDLAGSPSSDTGINDWIPYAGERQIGANWYAFNRIVEGNTGSAQEIYNWAQRQLRKLTDINENANGDNFGTVNGNLAISLMGYLGDTLQTNPGVYIDNFDINDQNDMQFFDITVDGGGLDTDFVPVTSTSRTFPFVATGSLVFSQNLVDDTDADTYYTMYFTNDSAGANLGYNFDTANAIIVNDNAGPSPIQGQITASSVNWDYDYDNNNQRDSGQSPDLSPGTDAPVTVVASGLAGAEWVEATFTIQRSSGQTFTITANDERNYANP